MIHYAELDERVNAGWPDFRDALDAHDKEYVMHMYEGANHGFHNDTTPGYDEAAARLAQERTIDFFNEHLRQEGRGALTTTRRSPRGWFRRHDPESIDTTRPRPNLAPVHPPKKRPADRARPLRGA